MDGQREAADAVPVAAMVQAALGALMLALGAVSLVSPQTAATISRDLASAEAGVSLMIAGAILDASGVWQILRWARRRPSAGGR